MQWLKRKEVWVILLLLAVIFVNRVTAHIGVKYSEKGIEATVEDIELKPENNEEEAEEKTESIKVDVSGAVQVPGVYTLKKGDRIEDVIQLAGGLTEDANTNLINQAEYIEDGQKIIVLREGENFDQVTHGYSGPMNLNTATVDQLTTLNGIGEKTAEKIIQYRQEKGPFKEIEDLLKVNGIGPNKLDNIRDEIEVK